MLLIPKPKNSVTISALPFKLIEFLLLLACAVAAIFNSEFRIPEFRIPNSEFRIRNSGIPNSGILEFGMEPDKSLPRTKVCTP